MPYKDGVRINTPHYLVKMTENKGTTSYTLIVSQYEKSNTIHYTLRVYSSCPFKFSPIADPYNPKYALEVTGEWKGKTAGGCENNMQSYNRNPIYQIKIDNTSTNHILVELRAPKSVFSLLLQYSERLIRLLVTLISKRKKYLLKLMVCFNTFIFTFFMK